MMEEEYYDDEDLEEDSALAAGPGTTASSATTGVVYTEPEPQKALNGQFPQFFVTAFKKGEPRIAESHQTIAYAVDRANYLKFRQGYYVWVYGGVELTWQGKEVGYQVKPHASDNA